MKNSLKFTMIGLIAFFTGICAGNYAISDVPSTFKIAVVDVQKVVNSSNQVKNLTKEQTTKRTELANFVKNASASINKETDAKKKKDLEEKYNKEFKTKQQLIAKNYETKLLEIDKNITSIINSKAKEKGYNIVLAKSVVLSGGTDITDEISKLVK